MHRLCVLDAGRLDGWMDAAASGFFVQRRSRSALAHLPLFSMFSNANDMAADQTAICAHCFLAISYFMYNLFYIWVNCWDSNLLVCFSMVEFDL
jgi:hypothetical protein